MTHSAYFTWLMELGMGWLGWDEETTLDTRMTSIVMAYEGRLKMLKAIFGGGEKPKEAGVSMKDTEGVKALMRGLSAGRA